MAGFCSFFKSESLSDTQLVLVFPPTPADPPDSISLAGLTLTSNAVSPSEAEVVNCGNDCKASTRHDLDLESQEGQKHISMPAHKLVLMAKSGYFHTRLSTGLGDTATSVITEHACVLEEVRAMESVVEFMYLDKLPLYCTRCWNSESDTRLGFGSPSHTARLLSTLTVADRWQVSSCLAACCRALSTQPASSLTWADCIDISCLPEGLKEKSEVIPVVALALTAVTALVNTISTSPPAVHQAFLSTMLHQLPASLRLKLLQGHILGYMGMMVLLSSDEQVTSSEDGLATFLCAYLKTAAGKCCTAVQIDTLIDQLRYQHMSSEFIGLGLPGMEPLSLNAQHLSELIYIRGLTNFASIPVHHRRPTVPASWYQPPRKQAHVAAESVELSLDISEKYLSEHLDALAVFKAGGAAPISWASSDVICNGICWHLLLTSTSLERQLSLAVRPTFVTEVWRTHVFADVSHYIKGAPAGFAGTRSGWIGERGFLAKGFVPEAGYVTGDATDIRWWKDLMVDGYVRFRATVTVQP